MADILLSNGPCHRFVVGVNAFLRPDMPVLAWFLCEPLRAAAVENIRLIQTGTASKQLEASHLKELP